MRRLQVVSYNTEAFFWPDFFDEAAMQRQHEWLQAVSAPWNA